jgi:hypothetical protein
MPVMPAKQEGKGRRWSEPEPWPKKKKKKRILLKNKVKKELDL